MTRKVRHKRLDDRAHVGEIRRVGTVLLRGAHAEEVDVGELGCLRVVGGKREAAGVDVALEDLRQARLEEGDLAGA